VISVTKPLFDLGKVVSTPGALEEMERSGQPAWEFLAKHVRGDWGVVDDEDKAANDAAIHEGSRILSAYLLKSGQKIWIITESDRSSTCLLLPEEY